MKNVFIIAEAGVNHNNKIKLAYKLIDVAKIMGADAIKFQVFKTENYVKKLSPLAEYQKNNTKFKNQFDMIKKLELSEMNLNKILKYCKKKKIKFLASPFDEWGINFLRKKRISIIKIPSGEINNYNYLEKIGKLKKKIILSTGMSKFSEIKNAIKILIKNGTKKKNITVLQCNSEYPTQPKHLNLNVLKTFKKKLNVNIGLSDHSQSIIAPSIAVSLGAKVIEKHFTLNKNMKGPDHKASLEPKQFLQMVNNVNETLTSLGSFIKKPTVSERKNIKIARKSLVAKTKIKKGDIFSIKNLICKRPDFGISASNWHKYLGKKAKKNYKQDDFI